MAVLTVTGTPVAGVRYTVTTANSADWASVSNSTYFFDLTDKLVHYKDVTGTIVELFSAGGSGVNIYNADGTLTADRTVSGDSKILTFDNVRREVHNIDPVLGDTTGFNINVNSGSLTPFPTSRIFKIVDTNTTTEKFGINVDGDVVINNAYTLPTVAPTTGQVLGYLSAGTTQWTTAGLSYFTEAQNTTAPNATVPVDSLTAVSATTNADFAILPKGTGAILAQIPDSTTAGGNKRGANSVDLQTGRTVSTNVASGQYSVTLGYNCKASATNSIAIGATSYATGVRAIALGSNSFASGVGSVAIGNNIGATTASGDGSVAMGGVNTTASGAASTAFGGATASGDNSFAVAYGNASGVSSVAMGGQIGGGAAASGAYSFALGSATRATGAYSMAMLWNSDTFLHRSRLSYGTYVNLNGSPASTPIGAVQGSTLVVGVDTNSVTPTTLGTYNGTAIPLVLQNNNSIRFKGTIIARQTGSTNTSAWDIDGFIQRGATAATTTLLISNVNVVQNTPAWGTPTLTADTTNGGLDIKVIGIASTLLRWTCILTTTEVILA